MKTTITLFAILCGLLAPNLGFAQGAYVVIDGSAAMLTSDCLPNDGLNPLPDGTVIQIRADQNNDGPDNGDPLLTVGSGVGEWNFNQILVNGASLLGSPGSFFSDIALSSTGRIVGASNATTERIFLAVMQPNNVDFWWWTSVYIVNQGYTLVRPDSNSGWQCSPPPPEAPPGDNCATAIVIGALPSDISDSTGGMSSDFSSCVVGGGPDMILRFDTPPEGGHYTLNLRADFNAEFEVRFGGACPGDIQIACGSDLCSPQNARQAGNPIKGKGVELEQVPGGSYYVVVKGATPSDTGNVWGRLEEFTADSVIAIDTLPFFATGSTVGKHDDHHGQCNLAPDAEYSFVAPDSGTYLISLAGSDFDTYLEVWKKGTPDSLIAFSDDDVPSDTGVTLQSELEVNLEAGQRYDVVVDGADSTGGNYNLKVGPPPPSVQAATCCMPLDLLFVVDVSGSMTTALASIHNNITAIRNAARDVSCLDLRIGLITYRDANGSLQSSQGFVPESGAGTLWNTLSTLNAVGGANDEPLDEALREGISMGSPCAGPQQFTTPWRECAQKLIIVVADERPGGCDGQFTIADQTNTHQRALEAEAHGIRIATVQVGGNATVTQILTDLATTTHSEHYVAGGNVTTASAIISAISVMGQRQGLSLCSTIDNLQCDPTGIALNPLPVSIEAKNNLNVPVPNISVSLIALPGPGGTAVVNPPVFSCGTVAPHTACLANFDVTITPNPLGGKIWLRAMNGMNVLDSLCIEVPPCARCCYPDMGGTSCVMLPSQSPCDALQGAWCATMTCDSACSLACMARCCYCDTFYVNHCANISEYDCQNTYGGIWTEGATCFSPCPQLPPQVTTSLVSVTPLTCLNGSVGPGTVSITFDVNNIGTSPCRYVRSELSAVPNSPGGTAAVVNPGMAYVGTMAGQSTTQVVLLADIYTTNPAGGCINFILETMSSCCGTNSIPVCIQVPPCCNTTTVDNEPANNSCGAWVSDSIHCGDTLCSAISQPGDFDWYWVNLYGQSPCADFTIDVFGNDTPGLYPTGQGLDPQVTIYRDGCSQVALPNFNINGSNQDFHAESCLPRGFYHIKVESEIPGGVGPYMLSVQCSSCPCPDTTRWELGGGNNDFTDFASLEAHFDTITIEGPQVINVFAGTYSESVTLGQVSGASFVNTITLKKANESARTNPVIQWNGADVVTFDGADYYVWDGIDVARSSTGAGSAVVFKNDADFNTIRNCALTTPLSDDESRGIYVENAAGPAVTNDNNTFESLAITGFHDAVRLGSTAGVVPSQSDNTVQGCTISDCAVGIRIGCQKRAFVSGNDISVSHPNVATTYAVNIGQLNSEDTVRVNGNTLHDLTGSSAYGIYAATQNSNSMVWAHNNMIGSWHAGVCAGIIILENSRAGVHFNSIYMNESPLATYYYGIGGNEGANITISNNTLNSDVVSVSSTAIPISTPVTLATDNNCFFGTGPLFNVGRVDLTYYPSLAAWQAVGHDLNSLFGYPGFVSSSDLHIDGFYTVCDATGVAVPGINLDIDGDVRDVTTPDIGADEFQGLPGPIDDLVIRRVGSTNDVQLDWGTITGAVSYKIYRHPSLSTLDAIPACLIGSSNTNTFTDTNAIQNPSAVHFYIIRASTQQ